MKKYFMTALAAVSLVIGGVMIVPSAAHAGGSDSPTPYTVAADGVYLPEGDTFQAHGHVNWRTNLTSGGMHFDPNNNQPGGAYIGKSFFPIALEPGECITWVQISHYNEHFGEGGQDPVCAPAEEPEEPVFDGVEKYTPTYGSTCDSAYFSHPNIKTLFGEANVFGIRYGSTQAEAQAKSFETYIPGTTVTLPFSDSYISNSFYFELKVGYDGVNLTHQIGQTRGVSDACDKPKPEQPDTVVGDEQRTSTPVCVDPADGTQVSYLETRTWSQSWSWDAEAWVWVIDKRVYNDWELAETIVTENEVCNPEVPEEPETPEEPEVPVTPEEPEDPTTPTTPEEPVTPTESPKVVEVSEQSLAHTGMNVPLTLGILGVSTLGLGAGLTLLGRKSIARRLNG